LSRRAGWLVRCVAAAGIAAVAVFASAGGASADTNPAGLWYFDALHVQAAHDAGFTGKGVTIAFIENQVNLSIPTLQGADVVVEPTPTCLTKTGTSVHYSATTTSPTEGVWHGTNVLSLIVGSGKGYPGQTGVKGVAPGAKVLFYSFGPVAATNSRTSEQCYDKSGQNITQDLFADAVVNAVKAGATIITTSTGFSGSISMDKAVAWAEHQGVVVVGSLPDGAADAFTSNPGSDNGAVGVQQINSSAVPPEALDPSTKVAAPGDGILTQGDPKSGSWTTQGLSDGTSLAAPIVAGFLAVVKQKYPQATGNQLIQTLITNTGTGNHPANYDAQSGLGYGVVSLTSMLAVDPTQYSDVNPLIANGGDLFPSAKEIATAKDPSAKSTPSGTSNAPSTVGPLPGWLLPVIVGGAVGLLVIVGVIILIVVLARRSSKRNRS
jgi:hypothetical protein